MWSVGLGLVLPLHLGLLSSSPLPPPPYPNYLPFLSLFALSPGFHPDGSISSWLPSVFFFASFCPRATSLFPSTTPRPRGATPNNLRPRRSASHNIRVDSAETLCSTLRRSAVSLVCWDRPRGHPYFLIPWRVLVDGHLDRNSGPASSAPLSCAPWLEAPGASECLTLKSNDRGLVLANERLNSSPSAILVFLPPRSPPPVAFPLSTRAIIFILPRSCPGRRPCSVLPSANACPRSACDHPREPWLACNCSDSFAGRVGTGDS